MKPVYHALRVASPLGRFWAYYLLMGVLARFPFRSVYFSICVVQIRIRSDPLVTTTWRLDSDVGRLHNKAVQLQGLVGSNVPGPSTGD